MEEKKRTILDFAGGKYSQNGENFIIDECINRINPALKVAVEFGAPTKEYCSNIFHLEGWAKYWFDDNPRESGITWMFITPENINTLPLCSIMSIDIDGADASLFMALEQRPDIIIIEINSSLDPDIDFYHPDKGSNFSHMNRIAEEKGYFLLCHTGNNIYILNKHKHLFPDRTSEFNRAWL